MGLIPKSYYIIVPKGTKFTGLGKLGLILILVPNPDPDLNPKPNLSPNRNKNGR